MSSDQEGFNCAGIRHPSSTIGWSRNGGILGSFPLPWLLLLLIVAMITLNVVSASGSRTPQRASATDMDHPLHVTWEDVTFEVAKTSSSDANRREHILRDVSGEALPGRLLAIMGPSGCGKTSLLNVLAGRVPAARRNRLVGSVEVGGMPLRDFDTKRFMAYVRQEQDFYPFLTVRETLLIMAGLGLDRSVCQAERETTVSDVMDKLGLSRVADTLVGDLRIPGISGGEKRRLAIGLQLIGLETPSVILLDEPTSGLDSHQALQVMQAIRDLCADGHTVVVSIHQPRSSIYALFDDVLLLSEGMVMCHGPKEAALARLASLGHRCPVNYNPADFMVDLISPVSLTNEVVREKQAATKEQALNFMAELASKDWKSRSGSRRQGRHQERQERWWQAAVGLEDQSERSEDVGGKEGTGRQSTPRPRGDEGKRLSIVPVSSYSGALSKRVRRKSSWLTQFGLLLKRSWRQATRDKFAAFTRVALGFGLGSVFGSVFWKLPLTQSSIQNRISLFVNIAINTAMFTCIRALQTLAVERPVIALERMDQGYSPVAYMASKILAEFPMDAVFPLIFGSTVYFAAGLNRPMGGAAKLVKFLGTLLVQAHASAALGLMVGCLSPSTEVANLAGPAIIVVFLMLSGVHDDIPPFLKSMEGVSTMKWGIQGIVTNEMRDITFTADGKKPLVKWTLGKDKPVIPGGDVMEKMGFKGEDLRKPTRRLVGLSAAFHAVTLINLFISVPKFQRLESILPPPPTPPPPSGDDSSSTACNNS